jgi:ribokinase
MRPNVAGCETVRCAVIGHVEWVEFARVPAMPASGDIVHASEVWEEPAGGGAVVARQLTLLNGQCTFHTSLGDDPIGHASVSRLRDLDMDIQVQWTGISMARTRRAWTHVDAAGERTITVLGDKLLPAGPLPVEGYDLVFFVAGDVEALRSARAARFLAATARELPTLRAAGVPVDLLVGSANDQGERYDGSVEARTLVLTDGARGGTANGERYEAVVPERVVDTYGAGDSFAAAVAFALARGDDLREALALGARAGSAVIGGRGPYSTQLALDS